MKIMTHIVGGYPTIEHSEEIARTMLDNGAAFLEIQIPFSDPVADGATIMEANHLALEQSITPKDCMELMKRLSQDYVTPLLFMSYFNILFRYGVEKFCQEAADAGCYGLIVPDIPLDEEPYDHYIEYCRRFGLHPIQVVSPLTPEKRLAKIGEIASGFVYCVARKGTTGASDETDNNLNEYLLRVKKYVDVPLAVGFGISTKEQIDKIGMSADIVVIGSHIIDLYNQAPGNEGLKKIQGFLEDTVS